MDLTVNILDTEFSSEDKELIKGCLALNSDAELISALTKICKTSFLEYCKMFKEKGIPTRADEVMQERLFFLLKHYYINHLLSENEISTIFQLTSSQSRTLLRNTKSRYRTKIAEYINNSRLEIILLMKIRYYYIQNLRSFKNSFLFIATCFLLTISSCGPKIYTFKVEPETTAWEDSVKVHWDTRGETSLILHEKKSDLDSTSKFLEVTLVVQKGNDVESKMFQVSIIPAVGTNTIILDSAILNGDTLIFSGEKNIQRWGNVYQVLTVSSIQNRQIEVRHNTKLAILADTSVHSNELKGTSLEGMWEIRTLLSVAEKQQHSLIPESLAITVIYQFKRR